MTLAVLDADPYAMYALLRREDPVSWIPELGQWLVTRWSDVSRVLDDPELFTNDIPGSPMIARKGPPHLDVREAMIHDYDPHRIVDQVDAIVRPCAEQLARRLHPAGRAELVGEYFEPVAMLSHAVLPVLKQLAQGQIQAGWLGGWTLSALLDHPDQLNDVRADRRLVGAAVYEALRWNGVVGIVTRRVTRAISLGGTDIPEGALLAVCLASANRDETVFPNPDEFDVHRTVRTHLAFGAGTHHCPAFAFLPAAARTAVDVLLDRMPDIRRASGWRAAPQGWKLRLPGPVNVVWSIP